MTWTLEQYEALKNAIALGVHEVMYGDKRVVYRSSQDMLDLLARMERDLGMNQKPMVTYPKFSKGLQ